MEQVAHQTIVMQFILEMARALKVDPRGCFRQFFSKIKVCEGVLLLVCLLWTKPLLKGIVAFEKSSGQHKHKMHVSDIVHNLSSLSSSVAHI